MAAHAKLSASGAGQWTLCSASVQAQAGIPDNGNAASRQGTAAHELAEMCLENGDQAAEHIGETIVVEGETFVVDTTMARYVQMYLDCIDTHLAMADEVLHTQWETRVDFSHVVPEGFGTADAIMLYVEDGKTILHVADLKYGMTEVDAHENKQGALYAIGAMASLDWIIEPSEIDEVRVTIHQPRVNEDGSTWETDPTELNQWAKYFTERADLALSDDPEYTPGEDQCRFCRAKNLCRARRDHAMQIALFDFDQELETWVENEGVTMPKPSQLTDEELAALLPHVDAIAKWARDVKDHAYAEALAGKKTEGYKLIAGSQSRSWSDEEKVAAELLSVGYEAEEIFESKILSPNKVEKLLGKKKAAEVIGALVDKTAGKPKFVVETHRAPAIEVNPTADFDEFNEEAA